MQKYLICMILVGVSLVFLIPKTTIAYAPISPVSETYGPKCLEVKTHDARVKVMSLRNACSKKAYLEKIEFERIPGKIYPTKVHIMYRTSMKEYHQDYTLSENGNVCSLEKSAEKSNSILSKLYNKIDECKSFELFENEYMAFSDFDFTPVTISGYMIDANNPESRDDEINIFIKSWHGALYE